MIQQLDRSRPAAALSSALQQCSTLLHPKLRRLLNPNVLDAEVRLDLHFQGGVLNHLRGGDSEPSYVAELPDRGDDNPLVREVLMVCLKTIRQRIEPCISGGLHGVVRLKVEISGGKATISSDTDWLHKPAAK